MYYVVQNSLNNNPAAEIIPRDVRFINLSRVDRFPGVGISGCPFIYIYISISGWCSAVASNKTAT